MDVLGGISEKLSIYLVATDSSAALTVQGWNWIRPAGITMLGTAFVDSR